MSMNLSLYVVTKKGTRLKVDIWRTPTDVTSEALAPGADPKEVYLTYARFFEEKNKKEWGFAEHVEYIKQVFADETLVCEWEMD